MSHQDRLTPQKRSEWSQATRDLLDSLAGNMEEMEGEFHEDDPGDEAAGTVNIVRTIAHNEALLGPFLRFASALSLEGSLSRRAHELLALRVIFLCQSPFEWGHHVVFARVAGLGEDEIARVPLGPDHPEWSDDDRLLLRAADEIHGGYDLRAETWDELRKTHSEAQLVEIPFVIGQYTMLSMVANATGVPIEEGLDPMPPLRPSS